MKLILQDGENCPTYADHYPTNFVDKVTKFLPKVVGVDEDGEYFHTPLETYWTEYSRAPRAVYETAGGRDRGHYTMYISIPGGTPDGFDFAVGMCVRHFDHDWLESLALDVLGMFPGAIKEGEYRYQFRNDHWYSMRVNTAWRLHIEAHRNDPLDQPTTTTTTTTTTSADADEDLAFFRNLALS